MIDWLDKSRGGIVLVAQYNYTSFAAISTQTSFTAIFTGISRSYLYCRLTEWPTLAYKDIAFGNVLVTTNT